MKLSNVGERFRQVLRTTDGHRIMGAILLPPTGSTSSDGLLAPRRILKVGPGCSITAGQVIITKAGRYYLCAENGEGELGDVVYKTFRLIEVPQLFSWSRKVVTKDLVTQLDRSTSAAMPMQLRCAFEPMRLETDDIRIPTGRYQVTTGQDVQMDDVLDNRLVVKRVENVLGIKIAEVQ